MGLGPYPEVSLSSARKSALDKRHLLRNGIDPIVQRKELLARQKPDEQKSISFRQAADQYISAHRSGWKNQKHGEQWISTVRTYALPLLGNKSTRNITVDDIFRVLEPIWTTKTETATRLRGRIESILDWCKTRGFREGDNPARWKGNVDTLLPPPNKVRRVEHHKALDWRNCPKFFGELNAKDSIGAQALKFAILSACRSNEVRGATWSEIDQEASVWTIPAIRMKAQREHRVPLCPHVLTLLNRIPRFEGEELIFPGYNGKPLSDMTLLKVVRDMGYDFTVHGFRSTFRDWAGETTHHPREVIEHALAHQLKDKAEAAYARGDLLAKRSILMRDWAEFVSPI